MIKKQTDISDATVVSEVSSQINTGSELGRKQEGHKQKAQPQAEPEPELLKPLDEPSYSANAQQTHADRDSHFGIKAKLQQAAGAAVLGGAQRAINSALNRAFQPRPDWKFATQSSANMIALGFGSGLMRPAPGTWGTVFAWIAFNYCLQGLSSYTVGIIIAAAFVVGIWACGSAGKALGVMDHGAWVWDEIVAFWLVLWLLPTGLNSGLGFDANVGSGSNASFAMQAWAFVLFRLFDIIKPPPIRQWDAQLKNGFGVMWDDIVAAFYTLLLIALWMRLFG